MKKIIFSIFASFAFLTLSFGQVTLPTSWGFDGGALPSGWTSNLEEYYTSSGNPAPAFKFGQTGRNIVINVASAPGLMKFDITGNSFGTGTFEVQESVDNTTYTTVAVYDNTNLDVTGSYQNKQVMLSSATRYIKFIYVLKAGGNVGLDNVEIYEAALTQQVLKVEADGAQIVNSQDVYVGAAVNATNTLPLTITNAGSTDDLVVTSMTITGADASLFSFTNVPTYPLTVAGFATENIGIDFAPTSAGTKNAVVTIESNDLDNPTFTFNVVGFGDNLATEPTAQPTNLTFSDVKTYRLKGAFTASSSAEGYIILRKKGSPITDLPVDGTDYNVGDMIGTSKVAKVLTSTTFVPNDIVAGSEYYFAVFAFNGTGVYKNYLTSNPLMNNVTTPANMIPAGEYDNIDVNSTTLISDLHGLVAPHTQQFYSNYAALMMTKFYERDTINNEKVVTDVYTGKSLTYTAPFSHGGTGITREHTFASSWFPIQDIDANFYSDYHNLFPISQDDANAIRSNYPLGIVVSDTIQARGDSYFGRNSSGQWVYEPSDIQKGAAARAMFYMSVRYTENGIIWKLPSQINTTNITYGQDQNVLKQWNIDFPPLAIEIARNDYLDSLQKNRNPFIDHPEYACHIDFSNMTYIADCNLSVDDNLAHALTVYPNPTKDFVTISTDNVAMVQYEIVDVQGRVVRASELDNVTSQMINVANLQTGIYTMTIETSKGTISKKLVIE